MQAETLNCPMCGAAARTEAHRCEHCGARLATVACPSCFGLMFVGAKFCSHCGARGERQESGAATALPCPRCRVEMGEAMLGEVKVLECSRCAGLWVDAATLEGLCANREKQSAVIGLDGTSAPAGASAVLFEPKVQYVPCPVCQQLMNRVNFARCSSVVVDVCKRHGTWFDRDELRRVVEFIRSGGLDKARAKELAALAEQEMRARLAEMERNRVPMAGADEVPDWEDGVSAILKLIFK